MTDSKFHETLGCEGDPSSTLSQARQGGQGEVVAWEVTRMGREPEVMSQAEFTRRSFDTGKFRPLVYGDAAQPAPVPAPVAGAAGPVDPMTLWQLYTRAGLSKFHLQDHQMHGEFERCIERFARSIEAHHRIGQQTAPAVPAGWQAGVSAALKEIEHWQEIEKRSGSTNAWSQYVHGAVKGLLSAAPKPDHGEGK